MIHVRTLLSDLEVEVFVSDAKVDHGLAFDMEPLRRTIAFKRLIGRGLVNILYLEVLVLDLALYDLVPQFPLKLLLQGH